MSPEEICPLPKAGARKPSSKGHKRGKTTILTITPEKPPEIIDEPDDPEVVPQSGTVTKTIGVKVAKRKKPNSNVKRRLIRSTEESDEDEFSEDDFLH